MFEGSIKALVQLRDVSKGNRQDYIIITRMLIANALGCTPEEVRFPEDIIPAQSGRPKVFVILSPEYMDEDKAKVEEKLALLNGDIDVSFGISS